MRICCSEKDLSTALWWILSCFIGLHCSSLRWVICERSVNNSWPNYCVMYLPCDISRDFKKCENVNLRGEWTRVVFETLCYAANNQEVADKKKADYQEGLEKSRADSAHESVTATWKTQRKVVQEAAKVIQRIWKRVVLTVQHEAAKVTWRIWKRVVLTLQHEAEKFTRKNWRRVTKMKLAWLYPTKVRKQLQL